MTDLEQTLVAALRAEAEEIAMSVDSPRAAEELRSRLDHADHSRHRVYWTAAALVLMVVAGGALLLARPGGSAAPVIPGSDPTSTTPPPGITYTSTDFVVPFTLTLPSWLSEQAVNSPDAGTHQIVWDAEACSSADQAACSTRDEGFRIADPQAIYRPGSAAPQPVPGYEDYVAFLASLSSTSGLEIDDLHPATVAGRPATIMTLHPTQFANDARFSCPKADSGPDDCWYPTPTRQLRLAAIDTGSTPLVVWMVGNSHEESRWSELTADFDAALASLHLRPSASPAAG